MATTASFDITSTIDFQEVDNALNQARKEVGQRYDFKGATAEITLSEKDKTLTLVADDEFKMNALWEIVQTRLVRRGVAVKNFKVPASEPAAGGKVRRAITIQQGIPIEAAREIVRFIKDKKLKKVWRDRLTTVFVRQGHYAHDAALLAAYSAPDLTIERIGELTQRW